jgi:hypothetical protein
MSVPIEELSLRWQHDQDIRTLNALSNDWLQHIYEGCPLDEVIAIMGQPQRQGPHHAWYVSKEGPAMYLEITDARHIVGWSEPK